MGVLPKNNIADIQNVPSRYQKCICRYWKCKAQYTLMAKLIEVKCHFSYVDDVDIAYLYQQHPRSPMWSESKPKRF